MGVILARGQYIEQQNSKRKIVVKEYLEEEGNIVRPEYMSNATMDIFEIPYADLYGEEPEEEEGGDEEEEKDDEKSEDEDEDDEEKESEEESKKKEVEPELVEEFFKNITKGYIQQTLNLFHKKCNVELEDEYGRSCLHICAQRGHEKLLSALLQRDADLEATNKVGWTPLLTACWHGQVTCIKQLVRRSAIIDARDEEGLGVLHLIGLSCILGNVAMVPYHNRRAHAKFRKGMFETHIQLMVKDKKNKDRQKKFEAQRRRIEGLPPEEITGHKREAPTKMQRGSKGIVDADGRTLNQMSLKGEKFVQAWKANPNVFENIVYGELAKGAARKNEKVKCNARDKYQRTPLIYAAREGKLYFVSRLIHDMADVNLPDADGASPLMHAILANKLEMIEHLIEVRAKINQSDARFKTPLHYALEVGNEIIVQKLLYSMSDPDAYDADGRTPLHTAMQSGSTHLLLMILEMTPSLDAVADPGWNILIFSVRYGLLKPLAEVVGPQARALEMASLFTDRQGKTALHHAVEIQNAEYVGILITLRSDCTIKDCNGNTALHYACQLANLDILQQVSDQMETVDVTNDRKETGLHVAASNGHLAAVSYLAQEDKQLIPANFHAKDQWGRTVLMHACISGNLDLVNVLILNREGVNKKFSFSYMNLNEPDIDGNTALAYAAREGHWNIIPSLIVGKASLSGQDEDGWGPLHLAANEGEQNVGRILLDCMAEVDQVDLRGWTPLMIAVSKGHEPMVRDLLEYYADPLLENFDHRTSLAIAIQEVRIAKGLGTKAISANDPRSKKKATKESLAEPLQYIEQVHREQIQEVLTDSIGHKATAHRVAIESKTLNLACKGGHFMVTVASATDLWAHGVLEENLNTYFYVGFRPRKDATTQGYASSCALQTRDPVWFDTVRLECDALDGHAVLCVYIFAVEGDPRYEPMDTLKDHTIELRRAPPVSLKKTPLELKLEAMKKAAAKRQKDEFAKKAAQNRMDAESGARPLNTSERQWLALKNYCSIIQKQQGVELHVPAVPDHHIPVGFMWVNAKRLRHAARTHELMEMERGLQCGQGRIHVELEFRPQLLTGLDANTTKVLTPRGEDFVKQVEEDYDIAGVQWLMKDKGPKLKGSGKDKGKDKAAKPAEEHRGGDTERWTDQEGAGQSSRKVEKRGALAKNITQGFGVLGKVKEYETEGALYMPTG
jgi:ankyrin repeat protein